MKSNLKVILAAIGITALASPALAQSASHARAARSPARISTAHGSVARTHIGIVVERNQIHVKDCVRVAFPQCSGGN
jgi:hypothetical protein